MTKLSENFLTALQNRDINSLKNALTYMIYETWWESERIAGVDYNEDRLELVDYCASDWTPLAEAAIDYDPDCLQLVLDRWPEHRNDLINRTYAALKDAYLILKRTENLPSIFVDKNLSLSKLTQAIATLRYHTAKIRPLLTYQFSKEDDTAYFEFLSKKMMAIQDVNLLPTFYDEYIETSCLKFKHSYIANLKSMFFSFDNSIENCLYSDETNRLITSSQQHAYDLICKQNKPLKLTEICPTLLQTKLFSTKHDKHGISPRIRLFLRQYCPLAETPVPMATKVLSNDNGSVLVAEPYNASTSLESDKNQTRVVNTFQQFLQQITLSMQYVIALIQHLMTTLLNCFGDSSSLKSEEYASFSS